jgi:hypothetical protein
MSRIIENEIMQLKETDSTVCMSYMSLEEAVTHKQLQVLSSNFLDCILQQLHTILETS